MCGGMRCSTRSRSDLRAQPTRSRSNRRRLLSENARHLICDLQILSGMDDDHRNAIRRPARNRIAAIGEIGTDARHYPDHAESVTYQAPNVRCMLANPAGEHDRVKAVQR